MRQAIWFGVIDGEKEGSSAFFNPLLLSLVRTKRQSRLGQGLLAMFLVYVLPPPLIHRLETNKTRELDARFVCGEMAKGYFGQGSAGMTTCLLAAVVLHFLMKSLPGTVHESSSVLVVALAYDAATAAVEFQEVLLRLACTVALGLSRKLQTAE
ncbi:hypothetical protein OPV22_030280 [Ensete ventricosum]|uniref:Uncharacterized protein n=1 Tax=Ensete ventricosum TaxID=4639 RepID=A0AAV8QBL3_ENSVE|nr:hypothetical protein OPV22_030280 [Ensete ventricosum]